MRISDWSSDVCSSDLLRRLAVFAAAFTLESATAVAAGAEISAPAVVDGVANLVAKSLLTADVGGAVVRYRLLDTTRAYALEKLIESGERAQLARRHAEVHRDLDRKSTRLNSSH